MPMQIIARLADGNRATVPSGSYSDGERILQALRAAYDEIPP